MTKSERRKIAAELTLLALEMQKLPESDSMPRESKEWWVTLTRASYLKGQADMLQKLYAQK